MNELSKLLDISKKDHEKLYSDCAKLKLINDEYKSNYENKSNLTSDELK